MPEPIYHFTEEELKLFIYYSQCKPDWDINKILEKVAETFDWTK